MGRDAYGINHDTLAHMVGEVAKAAALGVQLGVVIGGGNIFRGVSAAAGDMDRATADYLGMLATVMNALALQEALERRGLPARVLSGIDLPQLAEPYRRRRALAHLAAGRIVIFAGGTGSPFFTTDTAASLRGLEIGAEIVLKATKVDGVYSADPVRQPDARRYSVLSYDEVLAQRLGVMDATAITLCRDHDLPLRVFSIHKPDGLVRVIRGEDEGTLVNREGRA